MTRRNGIALSICLVFAFTALPHAISQTPSLGCASTEKQTTQLSKDKEDSRAAFLKAIDPDTWNELRKDAAPNACLFGRFSLKQTFDEFSKERDLYLQVQSANSEAVEQIAPQHTGLPEATALPAGQAASAGASPPLTPSGGKVSPITSWSIGMNAPEQMINGTQSSQSFGGLLAYSLTSTSFLNRLDFSATGLHTRSWKAASPSIEVDSSDAFLKAAHSIGPIWNLYGITEDFFNTSLGLALQQSYGLGGSYRLKKPLIGNPGGSLTYSGAVEARYFGERLHNTTDPLHLAGLRLEQQLVFRRFADPGRLKADKYAIRGHFWVNEMLNNQQALQGFADLAISFPVRRSFCVSISEEDDYLDNAPTGYRKNYVSSKVTLSLTHGSYPNNRCY